MNEQKKDLKDIKKSDDVEKAVSRVVKKLYDPETGTQNFNIIPLAFASNPVQAAEIISAVLEKILIPLIMSMVKDSSVTEPIMKAIEAMGSSINKEELMDVIKKSLISALEKRMF